MLYSIFIFDDEPTTRAMSETALEAQLAKHRAMQQQLKARGQLGPVAKLMSTATAMSLRQGKNNEITVLDGPYGETKAQLAGFYLIHADSLEAAINTAKRLPIEGAIHLEVRPVASYQPGNLAQP